MIVSIHGSIICTYWLYKTIETRVFRSGYNKCFGHISTFKLRFLTLFQTRYYKSKYYRFKNQNNLTYRINFIWILSNTSNFKPGFSGIPTYMISITTISLFNLERKLDLVIYLSAFFFTFAAWEELLRQGNQLCRG